MDDKNYTQSYTLWSAQDTSARDTGTSDVDIFSPDGQRPNF